MVRSGQGKERLGSRRTDIKTIKNYYSLGKIIISFSGQGKGPNPGLEIKDGTLGIRILGPGNDNQPQRLFCPTKTKPGKREPHEGPQTPRGSNSL